MARSYESKRVVYSQAFLVSVLGAFKVVPGAELIDTAKLRLSADPDFNPQPDTTLASLIAQEGAFSGYTPGGYAVVLGTVVNLSADARGYVVGALPIMATADPLVSKVITGWWIDDGANWLCAEAFPTGVTFSFETVGDYLDLLAVIPLPYRVETGL